MTMLKCPVCKEPLAESTSGLLCQRGCGGIKMSNNARLKRWFKANPVDGRGRKPLPGQQNLFDTSGDGENV